MKKLAVLCLMLFVVLSFASAHNPKKESKKVKFLIEKINLRLDSLVKTEPYEVIKGRRYYRFCGGVLTQRSDTIIMGAFGGLDRIHFTSHNGEISFTGVDEEGKPFKKTLEQLLFALQEY